MQHMVVQSHERRIGQLLIESGYITPDQLEIALKRQRQCGERIGSILLQMGFLSTETLLEFLRIHLSAPSIDLYRIYIDPSILNSLSLEQMKKYQALPITSSTSGLFVAMADPNNISAIDALEFILGKKVEPLVVPHTQIESVFRYIEKKGGHIDAPLSGEEVQKEEAGNAATGNVELENLISLLISENASDLLISAGVPPCLKLNGEIVRQPGSNLTPHDVEQTAKELMTDAQWREFEARGELDFGLSNPTIGRFRINAYRQRGSISLAIRNIVENIPTLSSLGLPNWLEEYALRTQGLILITGPTGHGKSTTLASLVDIINSKRKCNIITIEDPIEFLHQHKMSNINQREVGRDTPSFHEGLNRIFRQAPDVIVIGEMRDPESFAIAVQAAETGHLVISTMHANSTTTAIERIIETFPPEKQEQMRMQFAEVFLLIMNQRLIPRKDGKGRALAYEKLANTPRIRNMIREMKTHQIRSIFQHSAEEYSSIDFSLESLIRKGVITLEEGIKYCEHPAALKDASVRHS